MYFVYFTVLYSKIIHLNIPWAGNNTFFFNKSEVDQVQVQKEFDQSSDHIKYIHEYLNGKCYKHIVFEQRYDVNLYLKLYFIVYE